MNLLDKLPKRLQARPSSDWRRSGRLRASPRRRCCSRPPAGAAGVQQGPAAECLERDWEEWTTFSDFPQELGQHLRTSNPIESVFSLGCGCRRTRPSVTRWQITPSPWCSSGHVAEPELATDGPNQLQSAPPPPSRPPLPRRQAGPDADSDALGLSVGYPPGRLDPRPFGGKRARGSHQPRAHVTLVVELDPAQVVHVVDHHAVGLPEPLG